MYNQILEPLQKERRLAIPDTAMKTEHSAVCMYCHNDITYISGQWAECDNLGIHECAGTADTVCPSCGVTNYPDAEVMVTTVCLGCGTSSEEPIKALLFFDKEYYEALSKEKVKNGYVVYQKQSCNFRCPKGGTK